MPRRQAAAGQHQDAGPDAPRSNQLEHGTDRLELHSDEIGPGTRVLVHDDLLATGGTAEALCRLVETAGGAIAACGFLMELAFLGGRGRLRGREVHALLCDAAE